MLELPDWVDSGRASRMVWVDRCAVPVVKALWGAGVGTLGCCCGHGESSPSIILEDGNWSLSDVRKAVRVVDDRKWVFLKWELVPV